ncbi:complement factor B [Apostichopus japonicus]|uniref:Complement factor B n=1 Tax=Stichopus japonicus TaxID=307972 RepID=A0A2G8JT56_STIJA|nr:complement factor B [Apostichopus japonicus]
MVRSLIGANNDAGTCYILKIMGENEKDKKGVGVMHTLIQQISHSLHTTRSTKWRDIISQQRSHPYFTSGYKMRVTCDPSFRMRPESAKLTCVGDSWEPAIECVPEDCDLLPPFPRGEISIELEKPVWLPTMRVRNEDIACMARDG